MEKRLVLALILSIFIMAIWSNMFSKPSQRPLKEVSHQAREIAVSKPQSLAPQYVKNIKTGDIPVDTPLYKAIFSREGGVLTSFQLKKYPEEHIRRQDIERAINTSQDENTKMRLKLLEEMLPETHGVEMVSLISPLTGIFPFSIFWQEAIDFNKLSYEAEKNAKELNFSFRKDGLKIIKKYSFREDYLIDVEISLLNEGEKSFPASPLLIKYGPGLGLSTDPFGKADPYYRCVVFLKEGGREKIIRENFKRTRRGDDLTKTYPEAMWGGLENKYFAGIFIPDTQPHSILFEKDSSGQLNAGLKLQMPELLPGGILTRKFSIYLGPKEEKSLKSIGGGMEKSIDYGMVASSLRIMGLLSFFYRLTRSWGLAIIMLTLLTKIVLIPLTQKSMRSMEKMQSLQPHMKELRLKYKNDPTRMNKELMGLYKKHGVNPMGGCLPMALQMPIFIALFTTLRNTIDLRGASFLWIKDLSLPDTVCYFGMVPVNPLPLVMGISMFWQQKMTPSDPEQGRMMMFMTLFFSVMFYNFSSGLVLYWFIQNILTILHQYWMKHQSIGVSKA